MTAVLQKNIQQSGPAIEVKNIVTRFGPHMVHRGISFDVKRGEIVALIGGSGSGKSTVLREILGLLRPTSGTVKMLGLDMWESTSEERERVLQRIGVLFQNGALFSALTVGENIAVPLVELTELPEDLIREVVELRLALTGLAADTYNKMPSELSGGMRKRVALARALAMEPEILFLDEPTSGLDPINARAFDQLVGTLSRSLGLSVLLVTHDVDTLLHVPDKIVVLGDGKLVTEGPLEQVVNYPDPWLQEYFSGRDSIRRPGVS